MKAIKFLLTIFFSLAVVACGGGGYGGGGSPSTTYSISGTVTLLSNGTPVSNVLIALTGPSSTSTTTNTSGNYSFTGLANGYYNVTPASGVYSTFSPPNYSGVYIYGASVTGKNFKASP
jgi:Carboxypeptidase regulatory-like domain